MSSDSKADKLAAARKLLKQHQKKKKEETIETTTPPPTQHIEDAHPPQASHSFHRQNGDYFPPASIPAGPPPPPLDPDKFFDQIKPPTNFSNSTPDVGVPTFPGAANFFTTAPPIPQDEQPHVSDDSTNQRLLSVENQLVAEVSKKDELQIRLNDANERIVFLENKLKSMQTQNFNNSDDRNSLEEKIKLQQKTIEILVREKSELQQELAAITEDNGKNSYKCMELSVKLKALKSEVIRLQGEAQDSTEARQQHNSILKKLELSLREANESADVFKKQAADALQELKTLNRKLTESNESNEIYKSEIAGLQKKLSMAEMKIAQLGGTDVSVPATQQSDASDFKQECEALRQELDRSRKELAETVAQYKDYVETLRGQLTDAVAQNEVNTKEKNELIAHKEGLLRQLGELEKQIARERPLGPSLSQTNMALNEKIASAENKIVELEGKLTEKISENERLVEELTATTNKLQVTERTLDQLEMPDVKLLQAAMESDRVAASRAIEQNNILKSQLAELTAEMTQSIVKLNNEKLNLTEKLQHAEYLVKELQQQIDSHHHQHHSDDHHHDHHHHHHHHDDSAKEFVDAVAQCVVVFKSEEGSQTDVDDILLDTADVSDVSIESVRLLELKLKKTMDLVASLNEEKQKLEYLNIQLQSETETICEYVTLYQNQRGLLQEKAIERERQLALLAKEREELKNRLNQINSLLPKALPDSPRQNDGEDESVVQASKKIKTLLGEIESSDIIQSPLDSTPTNFHPCLLCSGKLITV